MCLCGDICFLGGNASESANSSTRFNILEARKYFSKVFEPFYIVDRAQFLSIIYIVSLLYFYLGMQWYLIVVLFYFEK